MRKLSRQHGNEEDEELKEDTSEINDTNESKLEKDKTEEALIRSLLDKYVLPKIIKEFIFYINTYEQDMIEVGNKKKKRKKYR